MTHTMQVERRADMSEPNSGNALTPREEKKRTGRSRLNLEFPEPSTIDPPEHVTPRSMSENNQKDATSWNCPWPGKTIDKCYGAICLPNLGPRKRAEEGPKTAQNPASRPDHSPGMFDPFLTLDSSCWAVFWTICPSQKTIQAVSKGPKRVKRCSASNRGDSRSNFRRCGTLFYPFSALVRGPKVERQLAPVVEHFSGPWEFRSETCF